MDNKEFFNSRAFEWDEVCEHNDEKLKKIMEISSLKRDSKILDIGTGTGILISYLLDESPANITAVDISDNMILMAKKKYRDSRVKFVVADILEYNKKGFDYIFLYSVYPHFDDKERLFSHLSTLINDGGKIIIAHGNSKEEINEVHHKNSHTKDDRLPSVEVTANIMSRYFKVDVMIDDADMYYISGIKA
ncbi:MAG: class I SAM-dependent methyltransferase [Maledivibacter sp.]|jgi:demethylmenaquinone methyltransferase/2-methoxy-6-polyprenyl-1,4-benzoquinol methylase|nr:class I SAM-dependent methyltransferase [Maledivibacter sp.]